MSLKRPKLKEGESDEVQQASNKIGDMNLKERSSKKQKLNDGPESHSEATIEFAIKPQFYDILNGEGEHNVEWYKEKLTLTSIELEKRNCNYYVSITGSEDILRTAKLHLVKDNQVL
eukprot:331898_1